MISPMTPLVIYKALQNEIQTFRETSPDYIFPLEDIKFKRCGHMMIVLYIPMNRIETNEDRKGVKDKRFAKFRSREAYCVCILNTLWHQFVDSHKHMWWPNNVTITYVKNQWIQPDGFGIDKDVVCDHGIHYFNHWFAAYFYVCSNDNDTYIEFDQSGEPLTIWSPKDRLNIKEFIKERVEALICELENGSF